MRAHVFPIAARVLGWLAVVSEVAALLALAIEYHLHQLEELSWTARFWLGGGIPALLGLVAALLAKPRGAGRRPALAGLGMWFLVPLVLVFSYKMFY